MLFASPDAFFTPTDKPWLELTRLTENRDGTKLGHKVQHSANVAFAQRTGIKIGACYKEENISTSDEGVSRETWERIIAEIEAGMWGGLLVWRADRLTRQVGEFTRLHSIAKRQRTLIATSYDGVVTIDPAGYHRMVQQINDAEREISTLQIRVTANSAERKTSGMYHGGGKRPWCFEAPKKDRKTGRLINSGRIGMKQVKGEVELAIEAAERIAWQGWTYKDVIEEWHARTPPVYGSTGAPWSTTTLRNALTSPRMVGRVAVKTVEPETGKVSEKLKKARWKPVLEKRTWDQLCGLKRRATHKEGVHKYLLTPILECGRCTRRLTGCTRSYLKQGEMTPTTTYRCRSHTNDKARGSCGKLNVIAQPVEDLVKAFIFERLERTREFGAGVRQTGDLEEKIEQRNVDLDRLTDELKTLDGIQESPDRLPVSLYLGQRRVVAADLEAARLQLSALVKQLQVPVPVGEDWNDLWDWFEQLTFGQRQKLVLAHVRNVVVLPPGRSGRYFKPERVVITASDAQEAHGDSD